MDQVEQSKGPGRPRKWARKTPHEMRMEILKAIGDEGIVNLYTLAGLCGVTSKSFERTGDAHRVALDSLISDGKVAVRKGRWGRREFRLEDGERTAEIELGGHKITITIKPIAHGNRSQ